LSWKNNNEKKVPEVKWYGEIFSPLKTYDYGIKEFSILGCNRYMLRFSKTV